MIELKQVKKERWHWTFRYEGTLYHVERLSMKKTALYTRNGKGKMNIIYSFYHFGKFSKKNMINTIEMYLSDYDDDENDIFLEDLF